MSRKSKAKKASENAIDKLKSLARKSPGKTVYTKETAAIKIQNWIRKKFILMKEARGRVLS